MPNKSRQQRHFVAGRANARRCLRRYQINIPTHFCPEAGYVFNSPLPQNVLTKLLYRSALSEKQSYNVKNTTDRLSLIAAVDLTLFYINGL